MTTYTLSDDAKDGTYQRATGVWGSTTTNCGPSVLDRGVAVLHFAGVDATDSALSSASINLTITAGVYVFDVLVSAVMANDAAPSATTVPLYQTTPIGVLHFDGTVISHVAVTLDLMTAGRSTPTAGVTWDTRGFKYGAEAMQAAWRKDSANATAGRTLTLVMEQTGTATGGVLLIDDQGDGAPPALTAAWTVLGRSIEGQPYDRVTGRGSRMIECPKSNIELPEDEAVMDGYLKQLVHPDHYDPPVPKPRPHRRARPYAVGRRVR